ncbi:MAG: hypothetical protein KGL10_08385 [Alphaproteobacteria bacterium]|nr:hypothetical protein [Alphaproteobacteria bacterium]MDE2337316.1 hypothetical protein [Alphaproteobacteria bacterium]
MNLNPFKKEQKQETAFDFAADRQRADELVRAAETVADPAEKIIALRRARDAFGGMIGSSRKAVMDEAGRRGDEAAFAVALSTIAVGAVALMVASGPLAFAGAGLAYGGIILGFLVEKVQTRREQKNLEKVCASHLQYLRGRANAVDGMMKDIVARHATEIAQSPLRGEIMKDAGLAAAFAAAAAKTEKDAAPAPAAQAKSGPKPAAQ